MEIPLFRLCSRPYPPPTMPPPLARDHMTWWLAASCVCQRHVDYAVRFLAEQYGPDADLSRVATRLRCRKCNRRPERVDLVDRPDRRVAEVCGGGARVRRLA
ncbi:hypothetical protein SAMN02745194_03080 [Roseomonas rosea]|uniref:Uncharacterized protein n=1 Tax=Muricoccus roseus TaxID=198092 RepID=A0A1M6L870_9PROT|nr:hypothetical protein [Roseomonas rosea]SHJ67395.1 hypothetical protein SAMN02745194_03080 [Roseomonas rosea]